MVVFAWTWKKHASTKMEETMIAYALVAMGDYANIVVQE